MLDNGKNDKRNGQGTMSYPDGEKYVGQWKNRGRSGQGTEIWPNGEKYVGQWKHDDFHGQGTFPFFHCPI